MHRLLEQLAAAWPAAAWADVSVLVAVSGGPDSVALLRALEALKTAGPGRLLVAHFNHKLRGPAADDDAAFVRRLAEELGLTWTMGEAAPVELAGEGLEGALRRQRYTFLESAAAQLGARYVVTGHTADDQAETILHRVLRGTGIGGLRGMARVRRLGPALALVRPLLDVTRADVIDYLTSLGQSYCHDATNDEVYFTRNRLRHELLPLLERNYNPQVRAALLRLGEQAGEVQDLIDDEVAALEAVAVKSIAGERVEIAVPMNTSAYLVRALLQRVWTAQGWPLQDMSAAKWHELAAMLSEDTVAPTTAALVSKRIFPGGVCAERQGGKLVLSRPGS